MASKKLGLQIYSIRDIYGKDEKSHIEALKLMKECGYDAVDLFGEITIEAKEMKKILDDIGLVCCGWHSPWDYLTKPEARAKFIEYNSIIGNKYLICPGLPFAWGENITKDAWLGGAKDLNEISAVLKEYDMYTGLHSHSVEFVKADGSPEGEMPWDIIAQNTCERVVMQLDLGNTYQAGVEPVAVLKKYPGRAQTIHLKPYSLTKGMSTPIGEDDIDWAEVVKFCDGPGNTDFYIVEYEEEDAKSGIKACADNFKKFMK